MNTPDFSQTANTAIDDSTYTLAAADRLTPIQLEPNRTKFTIADTFIEQAQANALFAIRAQVVQLNEKTRAGYLNEFHNWAISVDAGRLGNEHPPQPPASFVVGVYNDEFKLNGKTVEWPVPSQTGGPICDMPPIPPSAK